MVEKLRARVRGKEALSTVGGMALQRNEGHCKEALLHINT